MKYSKHGYKRNSKDRNNPYNIIPSGDITMKGVDFPVYGVDNLGNEQIMMPGGEYIFPGNQVFEVPLAQIGGAVNSAYDQHPFEKFAESQGMSVEEALQIVLSDSESYPPEILNAAKDYQLEMQIRNPVNDKQDESLYSVKEQQALPKAQKKGEIKFNMTNEQKEVLNNIINKGDFKKKQVKEFDPNINIVTSNDLNPGTVRQDNVGNLSPRIKNLNPNINYVADEYTGPYVDGDVSRHHDDRTWLEWAEDIQKIAANDKDLNWLERAALNTIGYGTDLGTRSASNFVDLLTIPSKVVAETIEGVTGKGDGTFNVLDALPSMEGKWEFKTAAGNPSKSFSSVLDPEGNWPLAARLTADIGTDPSTWFGMGLLSKAGKFDDIVKAIPGTQKNIVKNIKTAMPEGSDWMRRGNVATKGSTLTYDDLIKMNQDLVNKGVISKVNPIGYVHGTSSASLPNIVTNKGLLPRNMFPEGQVPMVGEMSGLGTYNKYGPINQVNQTGLSVAPISNTTDALNYAKTMSKNKININSLLEGHNTMIDDVARFNEPWVKNNMGIDYYENLLNVKKNRISNFHNADIASQNIMEQNYPMIFGINPKSTTKLGKDRFFTGISSDLGQEAAIKDAINLSEISNVFVPKNKIQLTKDYFGKDLGNIMIKDIGTLPKTYYKDGGSLPNFQNRGEVSVDDTYVAPFESQNIEENSINKINIPGSPTLNFALNKVFPEGWDQVNEEFKSTTEALNVDDNFYKNKSVLNWMVQNLAPALKTVWHGTNKLGMNPAQTEKNMKIALETVQNEFVPWSEAKPLLSKKYPFHDAAMDAAGMFHPSIDLVHMKEKYDSGDPDWPWYGLSILPFIPAGSFINKVVGKGGKINQKAFNTLDAEQKQVIEFYQSIDKTKKLVHPVTGKETNITAFLDDIERTQSTSHSKAVKGGKYGLNNESLTYHNIVANYINQLKTNKLIDEDLKIIAPNLNAKGLDDLSKFIRDWKGSSQHYTKLSRTMLEFENEIGKRITSKNVDEVVKSDKFWKWIDEQPSHVTIDWTDYTKLNAPGSTSRGSSTINKENFIEDIKKLVNLESGMTPLKKDMTLISWRNARTNLYPNINRSVKPGLISSSSYPDFVFNSLHVNPRIQDRHIFNVKSGTPAIGMDAVDLSTGLYTGPFMDPKFGVPKIGVDPSQIRRNPIEHYPNFAKESEMVLSPHAKFTYTGRTPLFEREGLGVFRDKPYPLQGKSQAQNIFWDVNMRDGGSLPEYQDQGEVILPMQEDLNEIELIEPANQNYYPDYDFYNISKQKENLIEKYNSPAFKDRYFKQYKNVTGNNMTDDEWNRRIAEQIEFTNQIPNQAIPINYDLPVNDKNQFEFYTEKGRHNLERMNPDLLQNILNESRGHVAYKLNEETGEYDFDNLSLLGPREFEALARFYAPGGPDSFSHLYGEDGIHPYADIIKTHETSHLYNSPESPLWKGVEGYTAPTNELDFYKNIFDQQGKYDPNFIEEQSPHISNIEEIGAGKVMFEKALQDFNIWDPNEGPFTEKHYKKLIKNLNNPDFLAHPGTGAGGFIDFNKDPLGLVGAQNEGATYLDDLGILNPTGVPKEYAPWGGTGYTNFEFPGDYDKENFFSGDEINPRNQLLHSENILKQIDSKFQVPEHLNREGDRRRSYKRTQRFENRNVKDFLSDRFTLEDLETGATWYGEDGYYNEEGNWDEISGITVPFTGRRKRILQNFLGRPVFPREADYYGSVADKKPIDLIADDRFKGLFSNQNHRYFSSKYNPENYELKETFEIDIPGYKYATEEQKEEINKQLNNLFTEETHEKINSIIKKNSKYHRDNSEYYGDKPDDWQFERQELTEEELQYLKNFEQNYIDLKEDIVNDLYNHYENKLGDTKENVMKYLNEIAMDEGDSNVISAKQGIELPKAKKGGSTKKYTRLYKDYKKHITGEKISPAVLKELYKIGLINKTKKELNLKDVKFNFEYNLDNVNYKKGGQLNLNLNQQIKFYEDYVKGSFDTGPKQTKANQIFEKLNRMYYLPTKKTGGNVLSYLHSISKNIS